MRQRKKGKARKGKGREEERVEDKKCINRNININNDVNFVYGIYQIAILN